MADDTELFYSDDYGIALWAHMIHQVLSHVAHVINVFGFASAWAAKAYSNVEAVVAYPILLDSVRAYLGNSTQIAYSEIIAMTPSISSFEWRAATVVYWVLIPSLQFMFAMLLADTFQYFTHRAFHVNKWLYSKLTAVQQLLRHV